MSIIREKESSDARPVERALLEAMLADIAACKAALGLTREGYSRPTSAARPRITQGLGYLEIRGRTGDPDPELYTCDLFLTPTGGDPIAEDVKARNLWQTANDATHGSGYTFSGDINGIIPLPTTLRYQAIDYAYDEDEEQYVYWFSARQDPDIECS